MDSELVGLASTAATTVVGLLATDSWEHAKRAVGMLWRRVHSEQAETVEAELANARAKVLSACEAGDERVVQELAGEWQGRLEGLLAASPHLATDLKVLVEELQSSAAHVDGPTHVKQQGTASGHGRIYQAGRDMTVTER